MLVLRWYKDASKIHLLACDAGISQAPAYRYLHEAIDVIAEQAPGLDEVLAWRAAGWAFVCLEAGPDRNHPLLRQIGERV